jgi:hypothetical protein
MTKPGPIARKDLDKLSVEQLAEMPHKAARAFVRNQRAMIEKRLFEYMTPDKAMVFWESVFEKAMNGHKTAMTIMADLTLPRRQNEEDTSGASAAPFQINILPAEKGPRPVVNEKPNES